MAGLIVLNTAFVLAGLVLLYFGGHFLVDGAVQLARRLGLAPLIIGLTVVAFGTSAPELFVSLVSALAEQTSVSLGNVVGSNIINIALILGLAAAIRPMPSTRRLVRFDMPFMALGYLVLLATALNFGGESIFFGGVISWPEGLIMVVLLAAYVGILYRTGRRGRPTKPKTDSAETPAPVVGEAAQAMAHASSVSVTLIVLKIAGGITGLAIGARLLVLGASWIAEYVFGASERFIGITVVALGTSLPELITSIAAAAKGEMDISLGNVIGSNIFNSLIVLGLVSIVHPIRLGSSDFRVDFLVMIAITLFLWIVLSARKRLGRWPGIVLMLGYIAYTIYMIETRSL